MQQLAAAYLRVSTDEQAEHGVSLPAQKSRLLAYATAQGWELYDYYIDDGYSGKNLERPAMQKLLTDIEDEKFNYIIVLKLDRFSRRQKDVLYLLEDVLEPHNIGFKSVTEPFDTTTPFGKAAIGMMAVFAQLERETIVERVKMAKKEAAHQGRFGGGSIALGYNYNIATKKLTIDESSAYIVRKIYELYLTGTYGFRPIANKLNEEGIKSPTGGIWYKDTVKNILSNPTYAGYISRCGEINEGQHDSIIHREKWNVAQSMLQGRYVPHPVKDDDNLLTGMIYCGNCGSRMRFKNQTWQNAKNPKSPWSKKYYICYNRMGYDRMSTKEGCLLPFIHAEAVNKHVIDHLMKLSLSPFLLKQVVNKALRSQERPNALKDINTLKKEMNAIKGKIERWNDAFEKGAIEIDDLMQRTKDLRERRKSIEESIAELETALKREQERLVTQQEVLNQIQKMHLIWADATTDERRLLISMLVDKIVIRSNDDIDITLNI